MANVLYSVLTVIVGDTFHKHVKSNGRQNNVSKLNGRQNNVSKLNGQNNVS